MNWLKSKITTLKKPGITLILFHIELALYLTRTKTMIKIIDTQTSSAKQNMEYDEEFLDSLNENSDPILHFYDWEKPSITHGYFIDPAKFLNLDNADKLGVTIARRPTGGGIVFHLWDLAFSFLLPSHHPKFSRNTLENYRFVNDIVLDAVKDTFDLKKPMDLIGDDMLSLDHACSKFCMARPTKYDVMFFGQKVAGAAQRKKKNGFLHQGTISIVAPDKEILSKILLPNGQVEKAVLDFSFSPVKDKNELKGARLKIKENLREKFTSVFDVEKERI